MNRLTSKTHHKLIMRLIAMTGIFLAGCQSVAPYQAYEGDQKNDNEIATFTAPDEYNLLSIDGVKFSKMILQDTAVVKLLPGSHQFIIEYQDFWENRLAETERVESKPFSVTFSVDAGNQYKIESPPLENIEQAKIYAQKPASTIINTTNKTSVSATFKYNLYGKSLFTTLFGTADQEIKPATKPATAAITPKMEGKALEMLKYWWESADENQQADFRQWLDGK